MSTVKKLKPVEIIVAMDEEQGIGRSGVLPWHLPGDVRFFKLTTTTVMHAGMRNLVIMGRKTWDSIPEAYRPLPGRVNAVISRTFHKVDPDIRTFDSMEDAIEFGRGMQSIEKIFVIGGAEIYSLAMPLADNLHITRVKGKYDCDVKFPDIDTSVFKEVWRGPENVDKTVEEIPYYFTLMRRRG